MTTRRFLALALVVIAAACTTAGGVSTRASNRDAPPTSDPTVGGSAPTAPPTTVGLPTLVDPDPAIVQGVLDNGLRYLVRENDNPGRSVELRLVVDAGSALQEADQDGAAHFLEHMLFNGTEEFPENELVAVLRSFGAGFGADINASTSFDETVYALTVPASDPAVVETGLDVLEQWLSAATIDPDAVVAERGVVLDEWRTSEQSADGRIFDAVEELFLAGTPYEAQDPIGTREAIAATTADPLRRFYDDWYRPDNVAVVVVGDVDAAGIEAGIADRFGPAVARGSTSPRPELKVVPSREPRAAVLADPDVAQGFALVNLPVATTAGSTAEERIQQRILDDLAFAMIATRLSNDVLRGGAPFEGARAGSSSIVRRLDAPEIVVDADGPAIEAAVQAVLDEYERVRRFGFGRAELAQAVAARRSVERSYHAGRETRQDRTYADQYVDHVLLDTPIATAESEHELIMAILDSATPETVAHRMVQRIDSTGAHVLVVVPSSEIDDVPDATVFEEMARRAAERPLEPRPDDAEPVRALMAAPAPVEETDRSVLADGSDVSFVRPLVLTFANGVRVVLNPTPIVEGGLALGAASPGGLAAVGSADVPDAEAAAAVVDASGLGDLDRLALDAFLADKDVGLQSFVDQFTEGFDGFAATDDLEVLLQLVHLRMIAPGADELALDQYLDDELPFAADRSLDPINAEFTTLLEARYDDPRFLLPTLDSLATVDLAGIERVYCERFGDAGDWVFALSGDFDLDEAIVLARRYLGTLPATARREPTDHAEPPPPPGIVRERVNAGQGDTARVTFLFTSPATADRRDDVAAAVLQELLTARLTDSIREQLGESYSPAAFVQLTGGGEPNAEIYLSLTVDPDRVDEVSTAVVEVVGGLVDAGPTTAELAAARETVGRDVDLFTNQEIVSEVLGALVDPAGNPDFEGFLAEPELLATMALDDVDGYLSTWLTLDRYIEVQVVPR